MRPSGIALTVAALCCSTAPAATPAPAIDIPTSIDIAGAYASTQPIVGPAQAQVVELINAMSGGKLTARLLEPGEIVPPAQYLNAVGTGSVDAAWTASGNWVAKDSAFALFSGIPFGRGARDYLGWLKYGGGETLFKQLHARYNVEALPCGISPAGSSGWFRDELARPEQFKDLKIRATGLAGVVLRRLGAQTSVIRDDEVASAFELNTVDAAILDSPALDAGLGIDKFAKNLYFPAWHQPVTLNELLISKKKWAALTKPQRAVIQSACDAVMLRQLAEGDSVQGKAAAELAKSGVKLLRWSPEVLAMLRKAWLESADELGAKSEDFRKILASFHAFREAQKEWREFSETD